MFGIFRNLLHIFRCFKVASVVNLTGLTLAFLSFMLISIHVKHEYGFDSDLVNKDHIYQLENLRDDGLWESNFSHPQLERFIASSPYIKVAAITNNLAYTSFRFGVSASSASDALSYMEKLERVNSGYTELFGFELVAGSTDCLKQPTGALIPESMAKQLFGEENPLGKPVYISEFKEFGSFSMYGLNFEPMYTVGGVYRDFPENTRVKNVLYTLIPEQEMMDDWNTGTYYCYLMIPSAEVAHLSVEQYMHENNEFLKGFAIEDLRVRPFAYKTPIELWVFLMALVAIATLTVLTVTFQSYRVATTNPALKLHR